MKRKLGWLFLLSSNLGLLIGQPVITNGPVSETVLSGGTATFSVGVSGTGPFTYQWQFNGTNIPNNVINTAAGSALSGFSGDGGLATNAEIHLPSGVAADALGNFYIADTYNFRIRKVGTNGIITTVAGFGINSYGGDGGSATNAYLGYPYGVAVDGAGNLYIADTGNNRIRKVGTNGIITTVAGTNSSGFFGDGGPATNAFLDQPGAVAVDEYGDLFIADSGNNRIREVNTNGIIMTVAGTNGAAFFGDGGPATNASLHSPEGVAVDEYGNLFIADTDNNRIREVNTNEIIMTIAGTNAAGFFGDGGAATNARLNEPGGIAVDALGYVLISDGGNNRVRQVDPYGTITTVAGSGSGSYSGDGGAATNAAVNFPSDVAFDESGDLLVADTENSRIRRVALALNPALTLNNVTTNNSGYYQVIIASPSGSVTSSIVSLAVALPPDISSQPQSVVATNGNPAQLSVTASGAAVLEYQWYDGTNEVLDATNPVLIFSNAMTNEAGDYLCVVTNDYGSATSFVATLTVLTPPEIASQPTNEAVSYGNNVVLDAAVSGTGPFTYQWQLNGTNLPNGNGIITRAAGRTSTSGFSGDGGVATSAILWSPSGVAVDPSGDLYIADSANERIRMVNTNYVNTTNGPIGIIMTVAGNGGSGYSGDGILATNTELSNPSSVAVDGFGNFYITDTANNRIREVNTNGIIITLAGTNSSGFSGDGGLAIQSKLYAPEGVAVDGAGDIFFADWRNNRVREINTNGIITTVAGTNAVGFAGDGGPAIRAELNSPLAVAVDKAGNLFIADNGNNRVRKVDINGIITTLAGTNAAGFSGDGGPAAIAKLNLPDGVAVDASDDVFISDEDNSRIRMVNILGTIKTVAGTGGTGYAGDGGLATNANIYEPGRLGLDSYGNLYIAGNGSETVRKVDFGRTPALQLNNVNTTNAGNYDVIVTSPYGSVTSSIISLTVLSSPVIVTQPEDTAALIGSSADLDVVVSNYPPFDYQWFTASGRTATAVASLAGDEVMEATVEDTGAGYVSAPNVSFMGGGGAGAVGIATVAGGQVVSIVITSAGFGYTTAPTVEIAPPPSVNAELPDETNASLAFSPVTSDDTTNYFVVITSSYGSVTSVTANLSAFLPPQNFTAQYAGTGVQLEFAGTPYFLYGVQSTTNLTPPVNWTTLYEWPSDSNGDWEFTDTNLNGAQKFYRAVTPY